MRKIFLAIILIISLAGWGCFLSVILNRTETEKRIAANILAQFEQKRALEESLNQDVEMQKRNALFLRQQEFEHKVEESAGRLWEDIKTRFQGGYAHMQDSMTTWQSDVDKNIAAWQKEFGNKTSGSMNASVETLSGEIRKSGAQFEERSRAQMEEMLQKFEGLKSDFRSRLQELSRENDQEISGLKSEWKKNNAEISVLREKLKTLEAAVATMGEKPANESVPQVKSE